MATRIESSRLILEPLTRALLPDFHRVWSDAQASFWSLRGRSATLEDSEQRMERAWNDPDHPERMSWAVYLRDQPETVIGLVQLQIKQDWEPGESEADGGVVWVAAYMFLPEHWGRGYATESVGAMVEGARPVIAPCTLQAYINPANPPSKRVVEKLGLSLAEKIYLPLEPRVFVGGEWREFDVWRFTKRIEGGDGS